MNKYVLYSSAWVEYFGGTPRGAKIRPFIEEETIATSIIAIAELADKCEREGRPFENYLRFIQHRCEILPLTIGISVEAAKLKNQIRKNSTKFGLIDGIHLATSSDASAIFITTDMDFKDAKDVLLIS